LGTNKASIRQEAGITIRKRICLATRVFLLQCRFLKFCLILMLVRCCLHCLDHCKSTSRCEWYVHLQHSCWLLQCSKGLHGGTLNSLTHRK
jgi:hypothetical protein